MIKNKKLSSLCAVVLTAILYTACDSDLLKPKEAPVVDRIAAELYEVDPGDTVRVRVDVGQPNGEILRFDWSENGGRIVQPSDSNIVLWVAPIVGGTYRISVKVANEHKSASTETIEITVRSFVKPAVKIDAPVNELSLVQYSQLRVEAQAIHSNGIHHVGFYVNDIYQSQLSGNLDNFYAFSLEIREAGAVELKVEAVANVTGTVGVDSLIVRVEGIVLGKS